MALIHYIDFMMTNTVHQWALFIFILLNLQLNLLGQSKGTEVISSSGLQQHQTSDEPKCGDRSEEEQRDENLGQADESASSASYFQCDWLRFCLQWQTGREGRVCKDLSDTRILHWTPPTLNFLHLVTSRHTPWPISMCKTSKFSLLSAVVFALCSIGSV